MPDWLGGSLGGGGDPICCGFGHRKRQGSGLDPRRCVYGRCWAPLFTATRVWALTCLVRATITTTTRVSFSRSAPATDETSGHNGGCACGYRVTPGRSRRAHEAAGFRHAVTPVQVRHQRQVDHMRSVPRPADLRHRFPLPTIINPIWRLFEHLNRQVDLAHRDAGVHAHRVTPRLDQGVRVDLVFERALRESIQIVVGHEVELVVIDSVEHPVNAVHASPLQQNGRVVAAVR